MVKRNRGQRGVKKFVTTTKNWMGDEDISCATDEAMAVGKAAIKAGVEEYNRRSCLQIEFMEEHEMLAPNVSRTVYSDGSEILANYSDADSVYRGRAVRFLSYIVAK